MQQEPNPPIEPDEPDAGEGEGRGHGLGKDRPIDPDTGKPVHPHGGPPGQAGRPPKPPKPSPDDQGGEGEGETGGA